MVELGEQLGCECVLGVESRSGDEVTVRCPGRGDQRVSELTGVPRSLGPASAQERCMLPSGFHSFALEAKWKEKKEGKKRGKCYFEARGEG